MQIAQIGWPGYLVALGRVLSARVIGMKATGLASRLSMSSSICPTNKTSATEHLERRPGTDKWQNYDEVMGPWLLLYPELVIPALAPIACRLPQDGAVFWGESSFRPSPELLYGAVLGSNPPFIST